MSRQEEWTRQDTVSALAYECINPDDFLLTPQGRLWTPERSKVAWELAYASVRRALSESAAADSSTCKRGLYLVCGIQGAGKSTWIRNNAIRLAPCIFFDAALPRAVHRLPIITIARSTGASVRAVWVNTPLEEALRRNAMRRDDERVPEASIRSVAQQFEAPTPAEGFVEVIRIENSSSSDAK